MAIRKIVTEEDQTLYKKSRPVEVFDERLHTLLDDMKETLVAAQGVGLAASQVGVLKRVVLADIGEGAIEFVNPVIINQNGEQQEIEGCLSCPGKYGITKRPQWVQVKAQDRYGKEFTMSGEGLLARVFCHEIDHLDGKLFYDSVIEMVDPEELESE